MMGLELGRLGHGDMQRESPSGFFIYFFSFLGLELFVQRHWLTCL